MMLAILFHSSHYRSLKAFYQEHVRIHLRAEFPGLVSYQRFGKLLPRILLPLTRYLRVRLGHCTGVSFIDSTLLKVCQSPRIHQYRVFAGLAQRGQTSIGWFYGFKLHGVVNELGELIAFSMTSGNVDDRRPLLSLASRLFGKLFGDRGYVSAPLAQTLQAT